MLMNCDIPNVEQLKFMRSFLNFTIREIYGNGPYDIKQTEQIMRNIITVALQSFSDLIKSADHGEMSKELKDHYLMRTLSEFKENGYNHLAKEILG